MLTNYVLVCYDADGHEVFVHGADVCRYHFYTRKMALKALKGATECDSAVQCAKLYCRRRAGGYRWVATRFRGGVHLTAWGE